MMSQVRRIILEEVRARKSFNLYKYLKDPVHFIWKMAFHIMAFYIYIGWRKYIYIYIYTNFLGIYIYTLIYTLYIPCIFNFNFLQWRTFIWKVWVGKNVSNKIYMVWSSGGEQIMVKSICEKKPIYLRSYKTHHF